MQRIRPTVALSTPPRPIHSPALYSSSLLELAEQVERGAQPLNERVDLRQQTQLYARINECGKRRDGKKCSAASRESTAAKALRVRKRAAAPRRHVTVASTRLLDRAQRCVITVRKRWAHAHLLDRVVHVERGARRSGGTKLSMQRPAASGGTRASSRLHQLHTRETPVSYARESS